MPGFAFSTSGPGSAPGAEFPAPARRVTRPSRVVRTAVECRWFVTAHAPSARPGVNGSPRTVAVVPGADEFGAVSGPTRTPRCPRPWRVTLTSAAATLVAVSRSSERVVPSRWRSRTVTLPRTSCTAVTMRSPATSIRRRRTLPSPRSGSDWISGGASPVRVGYAMPTERVVAEVAVTLLSSAVWVSSTRPSPSWFVSARREIGGARRGRDAGVDARGAVGPLAADRASGEGPAARPAAVAVGDEREPVARASRSRCRT